MRKVLKFLASRMTIAAFLILIQVLLLFLWLYRITIAYELVTLFNVLGIITVVYVINKEEDASYKIGWCIMILVLPVFGVMMYLLCAGRTMPKKLAKGTTQANHDMQGLLHQDEKVTEALRQERPDIAKLFDCGLLSSNFPVYRNTESVYFPSGEAMYPVLVEELKKAEHFIFLEYFIIDTGTVWNEILTVLKEKAASGVEVKLIYDDFGCMEKLPRRYDRMLNEAGIETYRFNPVRPALIIQMNNRDHRKICVIDNRVGFTGGVNLADEYMNLKRRFGYWKDSAVMLKGDAVRSLTDMFLGMYTYLAGDHKTIDYSRYLQETESGTGDGYYQPFSDTPTDGADVGLSMHLNLVNNARRYIYIDTPYLILNQDMQRALCLSAQNGVDVRILVPHIPDKRIVNMVTKSNYMPLLKAGVRIFEYSPGFNHTKNIVSDDEVGLIGSINTDYRSYFLHFEDGVLMYNSETVQEMKQDFLNAVRISHETTLSECMKVSPAVRTFRALLRVFTPLF